LKIKYPITNNNLYFLGVNRPDVVEFLGNTLTKFLSQAPQKLCLEFIKSVAQHGTRIWKNKQSALHSKIIQCLSKEKLVVDDVNKRRRRFDECIDPQDHLVSNLLLNNDQKDDDVENSFPPEAYRDPDILKIMRQCGMRTIKDGETFIELARYVEKKADKKTGMNLVDYLVANHGSLKWDNSHYMRVQTIAFVPTFKWQPVIPVSFKLGIPQYDLDNHFATMNTLNSGSVSLSKFGALTFTQCEVLPVALDCLSNTLRTRLHISSPTPSVVVKNLKECLKIVLDEEKLLLNKKTYNHILISSLKFLTKSIKSNKSNHEIIYEELFDQKFVLLEDKYYFANELSVDPPEHLEEFRSLLLLLSRPKLRQDRKEKPIEPIVYASIPNNKSLVQHLWKTLQTSWREPDDYIQSKNNGLFDIRFIISNEEPSSELQIQTISMAHRVVLAVSASYFNNIFTGELQGDSDEYMLWNSNMKCYDMYLEPWIDKVAFRLLLEYLYTADFHSIKTKLLANADFLRCAVILLRLSDVYMLDHLKQSIEVLIVEEGIDARNCCNLLTHAYHCQASQLLESVVYFMSTIRPALEKESSFLDLSNELLQLFD